MVRILLIDDNETDRVLVKRELGRVFASLEPHEVRNEAELAQALEAGNFDLAVTDHQLQWSDGLVVLNAIKARFPDRPVVMFTGSGNEEVAVEAMKAGLDDYVIKSPRHVVRLVTAVRSALDKADARRRAEAAERDRAELLRREQAAREQAERLLEEAKAADRRKDEFLAMLAHELRNPLSPMMNAVHLLRQPQMGLHEMEQVRAMLERQVRHLARIVDDLLDVSRITRGKIALRKCRLDLAGLVQQAGDDQRNTVEGNGLTLDVEVPEGPVWVLGDSTRLLQVMSNLLQNSAKFTSPGGRVVVRLKTDRSRQRAVVEVQDTGIGIEPGFLPHMFDIFTQGDRSLDRSRGGLGIGLALARGLVDLHGGQISAASDGPGRGSTFSFWVPLEAERRSVADTLPAVGSVSAPLRILIIEDNPDSAESLRMVLALSGHTVHAVRTGPAGLEAVKQFRPAVVLCDLGLPGELNGYDVARVLRRDPATAQLRLIAVSGYGQPEHQHQALAAVFDLHLTKPVDPRELQRRLASPVFEAQPPVSP